MTQEEVRVLVEAARLEEREACAQECDRLADEAPMLSESMMGRLCAVTIRQRSGETATVTQ